MTFAINSDAISNDFLTAVTLGLEWGLDTFELKRVNQKRVPNLNRDEINYIKSTINNKNINISALSPGLFKCDFNQENIVKETASFLNTLELAQELSINKIILFGFELDETKKFENVENHIIDVFGNLTSKAEKLGIEICIENDRHQWTSNPTNLLKIVETINSKCLGINWDPANLIGQNYGTNFSEIYLKLKSFIRYSHVKDGILNDNCTDIINCMVGDGIVDWEMQFSLFLNYTPDIYCVIEPHFGCRIDGSRKHISETKNLYRRSLQKINNNNNVTKS